MLLVVDANIVFSSLIRRGNPFKVFEANKIFKTFEFIAPEFLFTEIGEKLDKISAETKLSKQELLDVLSFIKEQIEFIPSSEFLDKMPEAMKLNFKDSPYLALALKLNCLIFSGDKKLGEQRRIEVLSPKQLLDMLGLE